MPFSSQLSIRYFLSLLTLTLICSSWLTNIDAATSTPCIAGQSRSQLSAPAPVKSEFQCGVANPSSRIVGGSITNPNEFPWLAYLNLIFWSGDAATCTGTLIGSKWILTAAHCTLGALNVTVTLGAHNINTFDPSKQLRVVVSSRNVKTHPQYFFGSVENDIALIELPYEIAYSDSIRPACLPYLDDDYDHVNETVTLTGWGNYSKNANTGTSSVLRKVETEVISSDDSYPECQVASGENFSGDKIICADGNDGRHYCYGDDGGPMNYYNPETDTYTVIGVAWIGDSSVNCQNSDKPNIYARVSHYSDWIYNNTGIVPLPKPTTTSTSTTTTTRRTTTTEDPSIFSCKNKPNGVYANPASSCSRTFYMCSNGFRYEYVCPNAGTVFNPDTCNCDFPINIQGC